MTARILILTVAILAVACGKSTSQDADTTQTSLQHEALVVSSSEAAGANCAAGGTKIELGIDTNQNGQLDAAEIQQTSYVCNGEAGLKGDKGDNGNQGPAGVNALLRVTAFVGDGANGCPSGVAGRVVSYGTDDDGNGTLDDGEVDGSTTVCDGQKGDTGPAGLNALVKTTDVNCGLLSGVLIESGTDTNSNGQLEQNEVTESKTVCQVGCGNGIKEGDEQCDDGNDKNDDSCDTACRTLSADVTPPTIGGIVVVGSVKNSSAALIWSAATDDQSSASQLQYKVVYSLQNDIATLVDADIDTSTGDKVLAKDWTSGLTSIELTGLAAGTPTYATVLVKDLANNKAAYATVSFTTTSNVLLPDDPAVRIGAIGPKEVRLVWDLAKDPFVSSDELRYSVIGATTNNISTVGDALANGSVLQTWTTGLSTFKVGFALNTTYYFTVLVQNQLGSMAAYKTLAVAPPEPRLWVLATGPMTGKSLVDSVNGLHRQKIDQICADNLASEFEEGGSMELRCPNSGLIGFISLPGDAIADFGTNHLVPMDIPFWGPTAQVAESLTKFIDPTYTALSSLSAAGVVNGQISTVNWHSWSTTDGMTHTSNCVDGNKNGMGHLEAVNQQRMYRVVSDNCGPWVQYLLCICY